MPINSIPYYVKMKKEQNKSINNKNINIKKPTKEIIQNLPSNNNKNKELNTKLLDKIKKK